MLCEILIGYNLGWDIASGTCYLDVHYKGVLVDVAYAKILIKILKTVKKIKSQLIL
jgi:hypothetical protein